MMSDIRFAPYQEKDRAAILNLFRLSFKHDMSENYWEWRFNQNPFAEPMIELAWDNDLLVAHYAVSPCPVVVEGINYLTALSMTTMTHPNYRGKGLFPILANRLYERLTKLGYLMVWGFPNNQSHRGFIKYLDWKNIHEIPVFSLIIEEIKQTLDVNENVRIVEEFDHHFDVFFKNIQIEDRIYVKRDRQYLNWRFTQNPQDDYQILAYMEDNLMLGYAVCKLYNETQIDLLDLLYSNNSVALNIIKSVIAIAQKQKILQVNTWIPLNDSLHLDLEKFGFRNTAPVTYLGAKILNPTYTDLDVFDLRSWHYRMADSDVY